MDDAWLIVVRPLAGEIPAEVRIRHLLKRALRDLGLKCTAIRDPSAEELLAASDAEYGGSGLAHEGE